MNAVMQMDRVLDELKKSEEAGQPLTIAQAMRKVHREYINDQLWNKYGVTPSGFLVIAGHYYEESGRKHADKQLLSSFNRYLSTDGKLTGENGRILREAMDRLGIDYVKSPTWPLEPIEDDDKASA